MFIKLELENIGPYTNKIILDFRVNKRDKDSLESVYKLPDGEMVTKVAGIIAGNAYGKTTILRALNAIGTFINNPVINKEVNNYIDKIKEEEELRNYLKEWGALSLISTNKSNDGYGTINVEMYIDSNDEYSGYYI